MNIAIIPARGGSKRIPRKNIREFCGRPMIAWPIETAKKSGLFDHIIVSTDDEEIAETARETGAETPFLRPAELSDDHIGTSAVISHALSWAMDAGWPVEAVCCIYATAAFVTPDHLMQARQLLSDDVDFVFPALRFAHPPQRGFTSDSEGSPQFLQPEHLNARTQDLPPVFHDSGQCYWGTHVAWVERRPILGPRSRFVELEQSDAWDIDNPDDWVIAEHLFSRRLGHKG